jgi:hypothetical protein
MKQLCVVFMAVGALGLLACENVDSEDVMTDGIYADINAFATGDGNTTVRAALRVGGGASNTFLEMVGDDQLLASMGEGDPVEMGEKSFLGSRWYTAEFDADAEDTEFNVAFERTVDEPAPESKMTMVAPFELTAPASSAEYSRATDDIEITWDASGSSDDMIVNIDGDCVQLYHEDLSGDTGSFTVVAGTLDPAQDQDDETCSVTIELIRHRDGNLDPAYGEGGVIYARQIRTIQVSSAP